MGPDLVVNYDHLKETEPATEPPAQEGGEDTPPATDAPPAEEPPAAEPPAENPPADNTPDPS